MRSNNNVDVSRLVGCEYEHDVVGSSSNAVRPVIVVYFIGGVTYTEIAALRYLAKKVKLELMPEE